MIGKKELLKIGIQKRNKQLNLTWSEINLKYDKPFKSGDSFRKWVYKQIKNNDSQINKNNKLNKLNKQIKFESKSTPESKSKTGFKESKQPIIIEEKDFYMIHSHDFRMQVNISKNRLRELKRLYCTEQLSINACCRQLNLPRKHFILIKTAFGITHDDVPFIEEDLKNKSVDELVELTLEEKKDRYFLKLQEEEIRKLKKENELYKNAQYLIQNALEDISIPIQVLNYIPPVIESQTEGQLNLADWHTGLKTMNYWNKYNFEIQQKRLAELISLVLFYIERHKVRIIHVQNLGDMLHGIIHVNNRILTEFDLIEQFRATWNLLIILLKKIAQNVEKVYFYSTYGNHSRIIANKKESLDKENLELLLPDVLKASLQNLTNIVFVKNAIDEQIMVADICGHKIYSIHGDRDRNEVVAKNLTMMLEQKPYKIFTGHTHHKAVLEEHKVDVIVSRSLCGVEDFAKNIRKTSMAGQSLYIYNAKGLECIYDITF